MLRRFAIRYSPVLEPLFIALGSGPGRSHVDVDDDSVDVRMGFSFRCRVPRGAIHGPRRERDVWLAIGVHTNLRGHWLVNGSPHGIVAFDVEPPVRARMLGIPVRVRRLGLALEEPEAFLAALGAPVG